MAGLVDDASLECVGKGGSKDDNHFDMVVGQLEEIVMEPAFQQIERDFGREHCHEFEDTEVNKFIYTDLHKAYTASVETYLLEALTERIPGFDMPTFMDMLAKRPDEISEDIADLLSDMDDFLSFKGMMLSYKAQAQAEQQRDGGAAAAAAAAVGAAVGADSSVGCGVGDLGLTGLSITALSSAAASTVATGSS